MEHCKALRFRSMAPSHCMQCGRPTRMRCVDCNPMLYVCGRCAGSHERSCHPELASAPPQQRIPAKPSSFLEATP